MVFLDPVEFVLPDAEDDVEIPSSIVRLEPSLSVMTSIMAARVGVENDRSSGGVTRSWWNTTLSCRPDRMFVGVPVDDAGR